MLNEHCAYIKGISGKTIILLRKIFYRKIPHASDKCIANCRCEVLNAVAARGSTSRDGEREEYEDGNEVERRLSEGRRTISSRPPTLEF